MPDTILAAIDLDDLTDDVLRTARSLADRLGDEVSVLRVASDDEIEAIVETVPEEGAYIDMVLKRLTDALEHRVGEIFDESLPAVEVVKGDPSSEILAAAADKDAAMIVMGVHSRSRMAKLLFGSVAQSVLLQTSRPVVAVPLRPVVWRGEGA